MVLQRERALAQRRAEAEADHVAAQLRAGIQKALQVLPQMGQWWLSQGRPMTADDWRTDAKLFLESESSLRNVYWFNPRGRVVWCVRPGTVPSFHCPVMPPGVVNLIQDAVLKDATAVSDVIESSEGTQFLAATPARRDGVAGYIVAAFDARDLATSALHDQRPPDYEIHVTANGVPVVTLANTEGKLWPEIAHSAALQVANRRWFVRLIAAPTDIAVMQRVLWGFGLIMSSLIWACTSLAQIYKRNEAALRVEVAERRRAQDTILQLNRDLQHQLDDFRTLMDVLPVGIAVSNDPECRDIWVNPRLAALLRISEQENISRSLPASRQLPHKLCREGREVPAEELPMQMAARTGRTQTDVEMDIVFHDGTVLNTLSYAAPVFDASGKLRRVINACVDITERKESERRRKVLESRLSRAEKYRSLGLMAGGIAHDFNNLLTVIIGQTEVARNDTSLSSRSSQATGEVLSAAHRAAELVAQLLAYTGHGWLELETVDLSAEVERVSNNLRAMVPEQIQIQFDLKAGLPPVKAGARELRQVLRNLVANAVEAIGERRGTIQIQTRLLTLGAAELARDYADQELLPGSYIALEVSDTGGAVNTDVAGRVFDPFFTTKFLGRGLGLSAVLGIMRAHHGGVRFDASSGRGVCVRTLFPVSGAAQLRDRIA